MEKKVYDLKINPHFESFIPAPTEAEYRALEANIIAYGCNNPIITCNGEIIDGHNRYKICHEHNIPFEYTEMEFEDEEAVKVWMAENQLGRRNLNTFQKCQIIVPIEEALSKSLKAQVEEERREKISHARNENETLGERPASEYTRERIAKMADTSSRTFNKAKYIILNADPATVGAVQEGTVSINKAYYNLKGKGKAEEEPEEVSSDTAQPCSYIDHPTEDPVTHREPEREQGSYQFVKDQVEFAIRNMIADMKVGVYCLSNDDFDKKKELKAILREGFKQAADIIDRLEKM